MGAFTIFWPSKITDEEVGTFTNSSGFISNSGRGRRAKIGRKTGKYLIHKLEVNFAARPFSNAMVFLSDQNLIRVIQLLGQISRQRDSADRTVIQRLAVEKHLDQRRGADASLN